MGERIDQALTSAEQLLNTCSGSPKLDSEVLLAFVLGKQRSFLRAFPEQELTEAQQQQFAQLLQQRQLGHPIAHLTGQREFWSLELAVNQHTLIPRPDTEILIEFVLEQFSAPHLRVADLGTGSGAIALAIASEKPGWQITATDQSEAALSLAKANASKLGLSNIEFKSGSWFEALDQAPYDLLISNPPYIADADPHLTQGDVRFEPLSALTSGADGLDDIRYLIQHAAEHLSPGGWLILEHGFDQKQAIAQLFKAAGFEQLSQRNDYGGNPRLSAARCAKPAQH